jgi:type 1 fimbria pilin
MSPVAGSLGVGPSLGDTQWFSCDAACVSDRACYFDDTYVFGLDGSFTNNLGAETWIEPWQGGTDSCGAPVAPYDGASSATYTVDEMAGTITLNGTGAYIGLPKANNQGELPNVAVPSSITYNFTLVDNNNMDVYIEAGGGVFWQYKLVKEVSPLAGTWQMAPEAGSLGVGPSVGDTQWFSCDAACVSDRACYFDDTYVFGTDGSFTNVLGSETWIEPWQGGSDSCGVPVAPHDGSNPATFTYDEGAGTLTLNGTGAYLGLPKANNQGELPNVAVPSSITYNVTLVDANTMDVYVESGAGVFWQYKLVRL